MIDRTTIRFALRRLDCSEGGALLELPQAAAQPPDRQRQRLFNR